MLRLFFAPRAHSSTTYDDRNPNKGPPLANATRTGARAAFFFVGDRYSQATLSRLRLGHSDLNAHQFRIGRIDSPICECGQAVEDNEHYLLECKRFTSQRQAMLFKINQVLPPETRMSVNLILGGPDFKGTEAAYKIIAKEVIMLVRRSLRYD